MSPSLNQPEALATGASAVKTPTQSIASPTPSTRGLHSQSPSSCHSWDTAVENPEQESDGDDPVAEAQRFDAQKMKLPQRHVLHSYFLVHLAALAAPLRKGHRTTASLLARLAAELLWTVARRPKLSLVILPTGQK